MNVSHHYVAPVHPTYETPNNVESVDVSVPFKRHKGQRPSLQTTKSKITISEEGENDIYDVPSEIKEDKIVNNANTSTTNGDDITEHTRCYRKYEAIRMKPDFHDVQLITNPDNLKKCPGTITAYCKDQNFIASSYVHSYSISLRRNVYSLPRNSTTWSNVLKYVMSKYISNPYVAPDGKGCSYNGANLLIRPSHCC